MVYNAHEGLPVFGGLLTSMQHNTCSHLFILGDVQHICNLFAWDLDDPWAQGILIKKLEIWRVVGPGMVRLTHKAYVSLVARGTCVRDIAFCISVPECPKRSLYSP